MKFPGRDRKPLKRDAAEQTNRMLSAVIMRGNPVLSKFRLDYHSVLASLLDVHAMLLLLNRQPGF